MENQRIRMSKSMLKQGLLRLLQEKSISQISISELCNVAEINRCTFYKYYGNQYDLLAEIEGDFFSGLEANMQTDRPGDLETMTHVFAYLDESRVVFRVLVNAMSDQAFIEHMFDRPKLVEVLDNKFGQDAPAKDMGYVYLFFQQGVYAIMREWLNKEEPEPPEEIAQLILNLQNNFIGQVLQGRTEQGQARVRCR